MAKDAYTKVEAHKKLLELFKKAGIDPNEAGDDIKKILAAKGGPKGADVDPGMIYVLPADQSKSKVPEIFITYCRRQWGTENYFNLPEQPESFNAPEPIITDKDILNGMFAAETKVKIDKISGM